MKTLRAGYPMFLMLAMTFLLACSGCDDAVDPCSQNIHAGRVQGFVYSGGLPIHAVVAAVPIVNGTAMPVVFQTEPHYSGSYSLDMPEGTYVLKLQIDGTNVSYDYPDTIFVDGPNSPIVADFHFGGLWFEFNISENLDGEQAEVILHRRFEYGGGAGILYVNTGSEDIENGYLNIYMPCVLPGEYQVEVVLGGRQYMCYCPYDGEHIWLPGTRDPQEAQWYNVIADSTLHLNHAFALEPARIEGRVSGAWLDMDLSTEPELSIVTPDSVTIMGRRRVNGDGSFAVDVLLPGPVKLLVTNYGIKQWIGGPSFEEATVFDLHLGETISNIDLVQSGLRLSPVIPEDNLGGAYFNFFDPISLDLLASGYVGGASQYIGLPNLWPGNFLMQVVPNHNNYEDAIWRAQWFDRATEPNQARIISIPESGSIVNLDLVLEIGGEISGQILQNSSSPHSHYVVTTAVDEMTLLNYEYAYYGYEEYSIGQLMDGEFKTGVFPYDPDWNGSHIPSSTIWYPGTTDWDAAEPVGILNAGSVTGIDFDTR